MGMSDIDAMLLDCLKRLNKMNEWEQGFISALSAMDDKEDMSYKQYMKLEDIWEKVT